VPDTEAKLPGRGLWVRAERKAVDQAVAKQLFARAAQQAVKADAKLSALTEARLVERMLAHLGLARRAGELILGFDQVERALRGKSPPPVVVEAAEAAEDGRRKLQAAARAQGIFPFVIGALTSAELSLALARANVVHAALKSGRIAERLVFDAGRLDGFRPPRSWVWAGFSGGGESKAG
jgi:ribosomal protein L30E